MAFAFVRGNGTSATTSSTTVAVAYAAPVAAGNLLVCAVDWNSVTLTTTVADSVNGAWTPIAAAFASNGVPGWRTQLFYYPNTAAGTPTVTATNSGTTTNRILDILEYSGGATGTPLDTANGGTGVTTAASLSLTTTQNNDLVVAHLLAAGTGSVGAGYVERVATGGNETEDDTDAGTAGAISVLAADSGASWNMATAAFSQTNIGGGGGAVSPNPVVWSPHRMPLGV